MSSQLLQPIRKGAQQREETMNLAPNTLQKAEDVARSMLASGERMSPLKTLDGATIAFVSRDREALVALQTFVVDGETFYVGNKRG